MPISFMNSRFPCFDFEESCFTAITVPSANRPYSKSRVDLVSECGMYTCMQSLLTAKKKSLGHSSIM